LAKRENTAINDLVARVSSEQTSTQPGTPVQESRFFPVSPNALPGWPGERGSGHRAMRTAVPATMPVVAPFEARLPALPMSYPVVSRAMFAAFATVADPPPLPATMPVRTPVPGTTRVPELHGLRVNQRAERQPSDTVQMPRHSVLAGVVRLMVPIAALVLAATAIAGYIAVAGDPAVLFHARPGTGAAARSQPVSRGAGKGTLVISSVPPCEIFIDGSPTGLRTPQRSIALPAGRHRIALVNREAGVDKTVAIELAANATENIIEDLTH
jgi:hypothetical protein